MNILLINQPVCNRGDESAHKALIRELLTRCPDSKIIVLFVGCRSPYSISQFAIEDIRVKYVNIHPILRFSKFSGEALIYPIRQFFWIFHPTICQILSYYRWADLVVCAPGGICMGGFQDWQHLFFLKLAKYTKKKLAYYGRSIGPFPLDTSLNKKFKKISNEMLNYFSYLSLRDKKSEIIATELGFQPISTTDTAFLNIFHCSLPYEIQSLLLDKKYMVFVPNYLLWHHKYQNRFTLSELVDYYSVLIQRIWKVYPKLSVVMLPQTFDQGGLYDDVNLFRLIAEQINDKRVIIIPDNYSSDIQQMVISKAVFVVGARYHSIVFAINQNIPFIALSYEHKMTGLLESLDCTDYCVDFQETMFSEDAKNRSLQQIDNLLPKMTVRHNDISQKARLIASKSMDEFIKRFYK